MKWHVWITGYPGSVVEIEEGAMPMSPITAMAHAARELKAHWHGEIIEMNAKAFNVVERGSEVEVHTHHMGSRFVRIDRNGNLTEAK